MASFVGAFYQGEYEGKAAVILFKFRHGRVLILSFIKSFSHVISHISVKTSRLYDLRGHVSEPYFPDQPSSCLIYIYMPA